MGPCRRDSVCAPEPRVPLSSGRIAPCAERSACRRRGRRQSWRLRAKELQLQVRGPSMHLPPCKVEAMCRPKNLDYRCEAPGIHRHHQGGELCTALHTSSPPHVSPAVALKARVLACRSFYSASHGPSWEVVLSKAGHFQFLDSQSMLQRTICAVGPIQDVSVRSVAQVRRICCCYYCTVNCPPMLLESFMVRQLHALDLQGSVGFGLELQSAAFWCPASCGSSAGALDLHHLMPLSSSLPLMQHGWWPNDRPVCRPLWLRGVRLW